MYVYIYIYIYMYCCYVVLGNVPALLPHSALMQTYFPLCLLHSFSGCTLALTSVYACSVDPGFLKQLSCPPQQDCSADPNSANHLGPVSCCFSERVVYFLLFRDATCCLPERVHMLPRLLPATFRESCLCLHLRQHLHARSMRTDI